TEIGKQRLGRLVSDPGLLTPYFCCSRTETGRGAILIAPLSSLERLKGTQSACLRAALGRAILVLQRSTRTSAIPLNGSRRNGADRERSAARRGNKNDVRATRTCLVFNRDL